MAQKLIDATYAIASWWTFAVLFLVCVGFVFAFNHYGKSYPVKSFDGRSGSFSAAEAPEILNAFAKAGQLEQYKKQEIHLDLLFPLAYGVGLAVLIALLVPRESPQRWLVLIPYVAALGDYVENICVLVMIARYDANATSYGAVAVLCSIGAKVKSAMLLATLGAVIMLIGGKLFSRAPSRTAG